MDHRAPERIVLRIEDQGGQGGVRVSLRGGDAFHDGFKDFFNADAVLGRTLQVQVRIQAKLGVDLLDHPFHIGRREIDLVDDRDDFEIVFHGQVEVRDRLGLNALGGVDQEQHPFAGSEGAGYFIGKIDVAGGVQEIQSVLGAAFAPVGQGDGLAFDRDAPFALDIHVVENLVLKIAGVDHAGILDQPVRQGRLAVVNVGNNTEITNTFHKQYILISRLFTGPSTKDLLP